MADPITLNPEVVRWWIVFREDGQQLSVPLSSLKRAKGFAELRDEPTYIVERITPPPTDRIVWASHQSMVED